MVQSSRAEDLRTLLGRFDASVLRAFQGATSLCQSRGHFEVVPEHFLLRMLDDTSGDVTAILSTFNVDRGQIRRALQQILGELPAGHRGKPALSPKLVEIFQSAAVFADEAGMVQIRPGLLMLAIVTNRSTRRSASTRRSFSGSTSINFGITSSISSAVGLVAVPKTKVHRRVLASRRARAALSRSSR